jgi:rhamnulokinase
MNSPGNLHGETRQVVAIDLGAQSCRLSLVSWRAGAARLQEIHRFKNSPVQRNGYLFWNLQHIRAQLHAGLKKCAAAADDRIDSIGIDGWAVDYVRLGNDGRPLDDPFCYRDPRTECCPAEFWQTLPAERLYSLTGIQMLRFNTLYQLISDRKQSLDPGSGWLNLPEYFLYDLGGERVSEYTNSTHTQLVSAPARAWCDEIFSAAQLDRSKAPNLVMPGTVLGTLRSQLADLPPFANCKLIAPACHDTGSAVAGIPDSADDWAFISSGTWSLVGMVLEQPCLSLAAFQNNLSNEGGLEGRIRFLKNVNGMWLIEESLRCWRGSGAHWTIAALVEACQSLPAPPELLDVDDPELQLPGEMPKRINRVLARKSFAPYSESPQDSARLANLIFHSLAARYAAVLDMLRSVTGKTMRRIYIVGGGSRNAYLNRLVRARTGFEVIRGPVESSTIGNAAIQMAVLDGAVGPLGVSAARTAEWSHRLADGCAP